MKVHLVDGTYELFRQFFGQPPRAADDGTEIGATYGVATTGVAGPDPSDGQPVGTAHIAVSVADDTVVRTIALTGDRHEIRRLTVEHALGLLLGRLREESY